MKTPPYQPAFESAPSKANSTPPGRLTALRSSRQEAP